MIHIHVAERPARAETWLNGRRLWVEATDPGETMADVLRALARQIVAAGAPQRTATAVCQPGRQQRAPVALGALATRSRRFFEGVR